MDMQYTLTRITVHYGYYPFEEKPKYKYQLTLESWDPFNK
jgi:hypothetical protein